MRAPYAPPAIRQWVQAQGNQPQSHDIACQRFLSRRGIRRDNKENLSSDKALHEHFCLNKDDRELAFYEGMSDIKDAATGMGHIADILFIGFGLRPEWDPTRPLRASDVVVDVVTSRQFEQLPYFKNVASKLQDIFVQELSVAHIWGFREKLNQVMPGPGYVFDPLTRQLTTGNVQLAAGQTIPNLSASTPVTTPQHPLRSQTSNSTQSASTPHRDPNVSHSQASTALPRNTAPPSRPYPPAQSTDRQNPNVSHSLVNPPVLPTTARITQRPARPSWIVTPPGSPSVALMGDIPPPTYYVNPDVSFFNFTQPVRDFLHQRHTSAAMLCKVDATLNYSMSCWVTCFQEAGLSFEDASSLRALILQGLSDAELRVVLAGD
ncbi:hypothetical protein P692DRAFT_201869727 [Suillus brevipes Sb2]|nr:hypothetical protein P692DRAFT_201869727 [Suillus brevipes Sb2]